MVKEADAADAFTAKLTVNPQKSHRISDKLIGIFFEDISRAADGGLCAELLQNGDFEYNGERKGWNAATAWMGIEASSSSVSSSSSAIISTENGVSVNNPHYAILSSTPIYNIGWEGIVIKCGAAYEVSLYARCIDGKKSSLL